MPARTDSPARCARRPEPISSAVVAGGATNGSGSVCRGLLDRFGMAPTSADRVRLTHGVGHVLGNSPATGSGHREPALATGARRTRSSSVETTPTAGERGVTRPSPGRFCWSGARSVGKRLGVAPRYRSRLPTMGTGARRRESACRKAVAVLRAGLDTERRDEPSWFVHGCGEDVELNPEHLEVDVDRILAAAEQGTALRRRGQHDEASSKLLTARDGGAGVGSPRWMALTLGDLRPDRAGGNFGNRPTSARAGALRNPTAAPSRGRDLACQCVLRSWVRVPALVTPPTPAPTAFGFRPDPPGRR